VVVLHGDQLGQIRRVTHDGAQLHRIDRVDLTGGGGPDPDGGLSRDRGAGGHAGDGEVAIGGHLVLGDCGPLHRDRGPAAVGVDGRHSIGQLGQLTDAGAHIDRFEGLGSLGVHLPFRDAHGRVRAVLVRVGVERGTQFRGDDRIEAGHVGTGGFGGITARVRNVGPLSGVRVEILDVPRFGDRDTGARSGVGVAPEHDLGAVDPYRLLPGVLQPLGVRLVAAPGGPELVLGSSGVATFTVVDGVDVVPSGGEGGARGSAGRHVPAAGFTLGDGEVHVLAGLGGAVVGGQSQGVVTR